MKRNKNITAMEPVDEEETSKEALMTSLYKPVDASIAKRIAAYILDAIAVVIISVGLFYLFSLIFGFDKVNSSLNEKYVMYGLKYYDEDGNLQTTDLDNNKMAILWNHFEQDQEACDLWDKMVNLTLVIPTLGASLSLLIFELIIPLCLKHGRTMGMYLFKIALISNDDIDVKPITVFIRFLFGKLLCNTLVPMICLIMIYLNRANWLILVVLGVILIANIGLLISSPHHIAVPDKIAGVYPCEVEGQTFFKTVEELNLAKGNDAKNYQRKKIY